MQIQRCAQFNTTPSFGHKVIGDGISPRKIKMVDHLLKGRFQDLHVSNIVLDEVGDGLAFDAGSGDVVVIKGQALGKKSATNALVELRRMVKGEIQELRGDV